MKYPLVSTRTVLVTGCSSGIGLATARLLRNHGWVVLPTARKREDLDRLQAEGFKPVELDVGDGASVRRAAKEALDHFGGRVGALVNNAGYGQPGAVEDLSREVMRHQFEVNVFGLQELTNLLIPTFREQGYGRIVNISSVVGRVAIPFMGIYAASKWAVEALSDALRVELRGTGIAVALVEPGPIATAFHDNAVERAKSQIDKVGQSRFADRYRRQIAGERTESSLSAPFEKPPEAVARKILHALESPRPHTRYPVTFPAYGGAFLRRFAPDWLLDEIMARRLKSPT